MKQNTMQVKIHTHLLNAARWSRDGAKIIRTRADRMDALDSIRLAERSLLWAKVTITETFMPRNEPKWPKP